MHPPSRERLGPGALINGKFRLLQEIGAGGMGQVYKAEQLPLGRMVAVKVVHPHLGQGDSRPSNSEGSPEAFQRRFFREAQALSQLHHRHIVTVFDYGRIDDQDAFFMVMEYLEGQPLSAPLRGGGRLDERAVLDVLRQLGRGLREVHQAGLVHRDLKPANVFLAREGDETVCKLLDFGLVKQVRGPVVDPDDLTAAGALLGSPTYMSPEQIDGRDIDARTDIYALGAVLYHCLAGKPPFEGSLTQVMIQHSHAPPPPLAERTPGLVVSPALEHLVMCCLAKEPDDRYPDADALLADLTEVELAMGLPSSLRSSLLSSGSPGSGRGTPVAAASGSWSARRATALSGGAGGSSSPGASGVTRPDLLDPSATQTVPGGAGMLASGATAAGRATPVTVRPGTGPVSVRPGSGAPSVRSGSGLASAPPGHRAGTSVPPGSSDALASAGSLLQPGATTLSASPPADPGRRWAMLAGVAGALVVSGVVALVLRPDQSPGATIAASARASGGDESRPLLRLGSTPAGAQVLEGGRLLGVTPLEVPLEAAGSSHRYELRLDGHEPFVVEQGPSRESVRVMVPLRAVSPVASGAPGASAGAGAPVASSPGRPSGRGPGRPGPGAPGAPGAPTEPAIRMTRLPSQPSG